MKSKTILVLEDDEEVAEALCMLLDKQVAKSIWLPCLEDLPTIKDQKVDAVLLDLNLEDCQGLATILGLRKQLPTVPIVVYTGDRNIHFDQVMQYGVECVLHKPVARETLLDGLARAIAAKQTNKDMAPVEQVITEMQQTLRKTDC